MKAGDGSAVVHFAGNDLFIGITPSGHALTLDTDHERNAAATPVELLLVALGCCTAVDVIGILQKKREKVTEYRVEVRGDRRDDHPRSYKRMEVRHIVKGHKVSEKAVAQAIQLSETKYCSVAASLRPTVEIHSTYEIIKS
jgi:putative redox protein